MTQLSLLSSLDPKKHIAIGRALAKLRDEDVLIVGSGAIVHNLDLRGPQDPSVGVRMRGFDAKMIEEVLKTGAERSATLENWESLPNARFAHPREEHFLPLHVAVGAAEDEPGRVIHTAFAFNNAFSLTSFLFG